MKRAYNYYKIISILLLAILFTQCEKDDSTPQNSSSIKMNDKEFIVTSASMTGVSIGDEGHTSITFVNTNGSQVNNLSIDVESFTKETIKGDYVYPEESNKKLIDDWLTNYSVFSNSTIQSSNLESGELSVAHNGGNNYTIHMNLLMVDGVTFNGSYTGDFQVMFNNQ
jgi:hypothetical protein